MKRCPREAQLIRMNATRTMLEATWLSEPSTTEAMPQARRAGQEPR